MKRSATTGLTILLLCTTGAVLGKLPAPSDEATGPSSDQTRAGIHDRLVDALDAPGCAAIFARR